MSIDQIDEFEQGERVRSWLKNNGSTLIFGLALGMGAIGAWNWWQSKGQSHQSEAAGQYAAFVEAVAAKNEEKITALGAALRKEYADTPYATLSALRTAEFLQSQGKTTEAITALEGSSPQATDPVMAELISLRIARLLLASGDVDAAITRLDAIQEPAFPAVAHEIRGDAEQERGNRDAARAAYEAALTALDIAAPTRPLLELKLTDAGGSLPDQPEI